MSVPGIEPFEGMPGPASPTEKATGIVAFLGPAQGKTLRPTAGLASGHGRAPAPQQRRLAAHARVGQQPVHQKRRPPEGALRAGVAARVKPRIGSAEMTSLQRRGPEFEAPKPLHPVPPHEFYASNRRLSPTDALDVRFRCQFPSPYRRAHPYPVNPTPDGALDGNPSPQPPCPHHPTAHFPRRSRLVKVHHENPQPDARHPNRAWSCAAGFGPQLVDHAEKARGTTGRNLRPWVVPEAMRYGTTIFPRVSQPMRSRS
jgi:hypothetical protein